MLRTTVVLLLPQPAAPPAGTHRVRLQHPAGLMLDSLSPLPNARTMTTPHSRHADPRRRHRPRDRRRHAGGPRRARRAVRVGPPGRRPGRRARPPATRCRRRTLDSIRRTRLALKGPLTTPVGRRLPLVQRAPARGVRALRQPAPGAHAHPGRPLRQHRPRAGAREPRGPLRRPRALHPRSTTTRTRWPWPPASTRAPAARRMLEFAFDYAVRHRPQEGHASCTRPTS